MGFLSFFKPSKVILLTYLPSLLVLRWVLRDTDWRINFFPCETKPSIAPSYDPQFEPDWCGLWMLRDDITGVSVHVPWSSYLIIFAVVVVLPYLLCCLLNSRKLIHA